MKPATGPLLFFVCGHCMCTKEKIVFWLCEWYIKTTQKSNKHPKVLILVMDNPLHTWTDHTVLLYM